MGLRSRTIAGLFAAVPAITCCAQQHSFIQYTPKEGLAQSQVRAMAQDDRGYLWFGTLGGASRFDGLRFVNHALREGLPDAQISAFHRDVHGTLWMAAGRSLMRWNGTRFVEVPMPTQADDARITSLASDRQGRLYLGTDDAGIFLRDGGVIVRMPGCVADSMPAIRAILPRPNGDLLIGTRTGLWNLNALGSSRMPVGDASPKTISALAEDSAHTAWVATLGDGLFALDADGTTREFSEENGLLQNNLRCLLVDDRDRLWVGSKFGLNLIDRGRLRSFTVHQGMPNDNINCALQDESGQLWFGTDGAGVLRYTGDRFVAFTTTDGLCSDQVMAIVNDAQGDAWLGTYGNGVCRLVAMARITTLDGRPNNTVWCGLRDRQEHLWFGTSEGLCRIQGGVVTALGEKAGVPEERTFSIYEDRSGAIWFGQRDGLFAVFPGDSVVRSTTARSIRAITSDDRGRLWLATDEGILVKDGAGSSTITTAQGLCDNTVFCLQRDHAGRLWAGTANGLACLADGRFHTFHFGADYGSNNIQSLLLDQQGMIWAGTNNGLFSFQPDYLIQAPLNYTAYDLADGLRNMEFNLNASFVDNAGRLFFGTAAGLVVHDPSRNATRSIQPPPLLYITGVRSFLNTTDWSKQCDSIASSGLPTGLHLVYRRNHLTFDYGAINTSHPERTSYRYRLMGYDAEWLPSTDARFASYSNLTQGGYTFEVVASADGSQWSPPARFSFSIDPPFWLRWWFFVLCAAGLASITYAIHRFRALRRARREKTRQLMLRSRMLQLEQQALNAHMNRHFVFNALNSIQYYINRQDRTAANRYLTSFAKLIRKNLDASQSDTTTLAEEFERLELYLVLEHMRFKDKFTYRMDVDTSVQASQVRIPAMMLQPYVENSIWHGILPMERPGEVTISAHAIGDGRIRVMIVDDGIGIAQSISGKGNGSDDHISRGIEITKGRADVLRRLNLADIRITGPEEFHAPDGTVLGTRVVIELPVEGVTESGSGVLRTAESAITFEPQ